MTTCLLNIHNAGFIPLSIVIIAMGFAMGGAAQIIAGIMEFQKENTFGATAFTAYGFFCGASAIYNAMGQILNQEYAKPVIKL